MQELLQVKSDILFHDLINQDNIKIIEWIVMQILNLSYDKVHGNCKVLDSRITRVFKKDRIKYVDIIIKYLEYEIILELNRNFTGNIIRNIIYGMTRIVTFYQKYNNKEYKNNYYKENKKIIIINLNWEREDIINKKLIEKIEELHGIIWNRKNSLFKVINIALDKYTNMPYNEVKKRERFYKLLTIYNEKELDKILEDEPLIEEYANKLKNLSKDEKYREGIMTEAMDRYFMEMEAYDAGEQSGIEKNQHNIVLSMYDEKFDLKLIAKITKLSIDKIKEIIKSQK